jgi:hypothetical protein
MLRKDVRAIRALECKSARADSETYEKPVYLVHNAPIALRTSWGLFREQRERRDYRDNQCEESIA